VRKKLRDAAALRHSQENLPRSSPDPGEIPVIVKPADGSGSRGVEYIGDRR
jgi:biotin carboxylase